jgi:RNA-directed DNA polymerase
MRGNELDERRDVGVPHTSDDVGELVRRTLPSKARHRGTELLEGTMTETLSSTLISTRLEQIAELAKAMPGALTTLSHHIDVNWLREAHRRTRKDGGRGVDGVSAKQYEQNLEANLEELLGRAKSGTYRAPPVRRVYIPKGDGKQMRPIGIPTFEDKVLQRAVAMVLEAVYEPSFYDFSYGFRPGRSAHQACNALRDASKRRRGGWILEVDIRKFFDTLDHRHLREILRQRIRDGVLLRLIGKWLNAGVLDGSTLSYPDEGTPQGGVISPLLANIYLHEVLDAWFARTVLPRLKGRATLIRYADDVVILFAQKVDAERVLRVLPERFGKYGLTLHPDKTRLIQFEHPDRATDAPGTFDLLGFTFYWGRSRAEKWVVKRKTAKDRLRRSLRRLREWCRNHRHAPIAAQQLGLTRKLNGHYAYFGIRSNYAALEKLWHQTKAIWKKALARRSQRGLSWVQMHQLLKRYPLPRPRIVHQDTT